MNDDWQQLLMSTLRDCGFPADEMRHVQVTWEPSTGIGGVFWNGDEGSQFSSATFVDGTEFRQACEFVTGWAKKLVGTGTRRP